MTRFILQRVLQSFAVVFVIVTLSFFVMKLTPGSPLARDRQLDPAVEQMLAARYGLDRSLPEQFFRYLAGLVQGDLGESLKLGRPVTEVVLEAAPFSLLLGAQALLLALVIGVPLGLLAGRRAGSGWDFAAMTGALVGVSIPNFVLAPLLILGLSSGLGLFPGGGWSGWLSSVLPSLSLGLFYLAYVARLTRAGMVEVAREDFIRTARSKGVSEARIVGVHAIRPALRPVVSYLGPAFAGALTGSVVIEKIFGIPGLGSHFVNGAFNRDYFLVLGVVIVYSALLTFLNLVVDLLYSVLDPRVTHGD